MDILTNLAASLLVDLLMSLGPIQNPAPPPCATEYIKIMPADKWICRDGAK